MRGAVTMFPFCFQCIVEDCGHANPPGKIREPLPHPLRIRGRPSLGCLTTTCAVALPPNGGPGGPQHGHGHMGMGYVWIWLQRWTRGVDVPRPAGELGVRGATTDDLGTVRMVSVWGRPTAPGRRSTASAALLRYSLFCDDLLHRADAALGGGAHL